MDEWNEGGCLCGQTRYRTRGAPTRVTTCHCTFCQRITGSGYLVEPVFERSMASLDNDAAGYDHVSDGSGAKVTIRYCRNCGTKLWLDLARFPEMVGIIGGTYDDPNWFDRSGPSDRHIFVDSAQRGTVLPAGVDLYRQHALMADGSTVTPVVLSQPMVVGEAGGLPGDLE